jgi:hypothetical protein
MTLYTPTYLRGNPGGVLTSNSTTTALTNGSTFTGTWVDVSRWASIEVAVKTDQSGTYTLQFSPDGTNADSSLTYTYTIGNINAPKRLTITRRYARVTFTNNSGSNQTYIRLQTIVGDQAALTSTLGGTIGKDFDAAVVRTVSASLAMARGEFEGSSVVGKFGQNPNVGTSEEDIWSQGGTYTGFLTAASAVRIKAGGDTNDTAAGTGARTIRAEGLDANFVAATEDITTAGASASSATTQTFIRVNRAYVLTTGTYHGSNTDDIEIETTGGATVASIAAGLGQTQLAIYCVPAGKTAYITNAWAVLDGTKPATIRLWQSRDADDVTTPFTGKRIIRNFPGVTGSLRHQVEALVAVPEKSDIWMSAIGPSGGVGIAAGFDLNLVDD